MCIRDRHGIDIPWVFNRKEAKDHGEGGNLVGAPLTGKVLIIDDVITAGTAIRESLELIKHSDAEIAGVCVSVDRQERGTGARSAIQELEADHGVTVITIASLAIIVEYLANDPTMTTTVKSISEYQEKYGIVV